ncbi:hypothetical protein ANN_08567 [Periplaneta americana]|uniref:Reverse transcriptase domain-containing protein n=1 Tax=Periplaneta americana TaxID=6978 RepID=A0ABQ8T1U3_PERAM|nr:hypothetical protein ANN_08567 [Periplaneta americana]
MAEGVSLHIERNFVISQCSLRIKVVAMTLEASATSLALNSAFWNYCQQGTYIWKDRSATKCYDTSLLRIYTVIRYNNSDLFGLPHINCTTGLLIYADDVNMLGEKAQTIRENTEILLEASKAIGLEVNPEKTKYMIMSRDQNIVRNGNIKIGDLSFEEVEKFKYLGATVTNINDTREEIKRRINMVSIEL